MILEVESETLTQNPELMLPDEFTDCLNVPISCIAFQCYSRNSSARLTVRSPVAPSQHACSRRGLPLSAPCLLRSSSLAPSSVFDPSRLWFVAPVASSGWICLLGSEKNNFFFLLNTCESSIGYGIRIRLQFR